MTGAHKRSISSTVEWPMGCDPSCTDVADSEG